MARVNRDHCRGLALLADQPGVRRVRVAERQTLVLWEPMDVECRVTLRAVDLAKARIGADSRAVADRQVVALHVVLGQDLPVGVPDMGFAEGLGVVLKAEIGDHFIQRRQPGEDCIGFGVQRDVDPAEPFFTTDRRQTKVFLAETVVALHSRRTAQCAVQIVGPGVIGAGDCADVATPLQQRRHAVQADIRHRPEHLVAATHHHDRLAGNNAGNVVAGFRQRTGAADADPVMAKHRLQFTVKEGFRRIDAGRHRPRVLKWPGGGLLELEDRVGRGFGDVHRCGP